VRLKQKSPFDAKVTSFLSIGQNSFEMLKRSRFRFFFSRTSRTQELQLHFCFIRECCETNRELQWHRVSLQKKFL